MKTRPIRVAVATTLLTAPFALLLSTASSAVADTPKQTGCPVGYQTLSVAWLLHQGPYQVPGPMDTAGNNDGVICGHALNAADTAHICDPCRVPIVYLFRDNDLTKNF
jgi:hypothetical protein